MRFLMLNWRDPRNPKAGGAERVTYAFLRGLVEREHEVSWYANDFAGGVREEVIDGIRIIRGGGQGTSVVKAIRWYRTQKAFDLVIDQHHGIPWFTPWWARTNCIAYIHEVLGPIWDAFYPQPTATLGRLQERWTHWLYRRVPFWVPSQSTKIALHKHGVREVQVFPNGTDTIPLSQLEVKPLNSPLKLITVSRLAPNKRVDHAIQALSVLIKKGVRAQLTIVGSGDVEHQLRQAASALGIAGLVTFTGSLPEHEKNAQLRAAHLLVHTSMREGWGLNVIEANALGTPAVVYPVGGLVDSTVHNETGMVAASETPKAVADSIFAIANEPTQYDRLRINAWNRAKTFEWYRVLPPACDWLESQAARND